MKKVTKLLLSYDGRIFAFDKNDQQVPEAHFSLAEYAEWCEAKKIDCVGAIAETLFSPRREFEILQSNRGAFNWKPL